MAASPSPLLRRTLKGLGIGLGAAALALVLSLAGVLDVFEYKTWDLREQAWARSGPATDEIVVILLGQESLDWGEKENNLPWPWPRETHAAITDFCRRAGAKSLNLDILYTEPSAYGVEDDAVFSNALQENGRVVGSLFLGQTLATEKTWPAGLPDAGLTVTGLSQWEKATGARGLDFPLANFPIPELAGSFNILADTNPYKDPDGVHRRLRLFNTFNGRVVPMHGLAAYLAGNPGAHKLAIRPGILDVDGREVPIDAEGRAILRFRGRSTTHLSFNAAAVIRSELLIREGEQPEIDPALLKDKYVFFGYSAPGLFDLRPSPMLGDYPGVELYATQLDNLLSGDFIRPVPVWAAAVFLIIICCGAALAVSAAGKAWQSALVYLAFLPVAPVLGFLAYLPGFWLPLVPGTLGVVTALVGASLVSFATEGRQKRYIKSAFRQYLSPVVIEELIAHPERLKLGGERRELSIYFSDLQGFTSLSEMLSPEELTALLNDYLSAMTDIIQDEGGTIDKFEGDAIIAFWNAPLTQNDHAVRAVRASLRCQAELARLRPEFHTRVKKDLLMRIGLNSGPAVVGNMGSRTRFDYTMLGDAVNLASRLEGTNKQFGTYVMASDATLKLTAGAFAARELSRVAVVGRAEAVTVYEPMTAEEFAARRPLFESFDRGLRLYYAGSFAEAERVFRETAAADPPAAAYAARCRDLIEHPPQDEWRGVWVMTTK